MIETIGISVLSTLLIVSVSVAFFLWHRNKKYIAQVIQLSLDIVNLKDQYNRLGEEYDNLSVRDPDGFIKFLSQSRDWAFGYIENVQETIKVLATALETGNEEEIKRQYIKLMDYLPKEEGND